MLIGGLESTFGTDYGLSQMPGFMQTGTYEMQMVSPLIKHFNYMDNSYEPESSSALFWFYSKTQDPSVLCQQVSILQRDTAKKYLKDRVLPAMLIWGQAHRWKKPSLRKKRSGPDAAIHRCASCVRGGEIRTPGSSA
ncbi:MAG: hypothetical protein ACLTZY_06945 [Alistipes indistinctus]